MKYDIECVQDTTLKNIFFIFHYLSISRRKRKQEKFLFSFLYSFSFFLTLKSSLVMLIKHIRTKVYGKHTLRETRANSCKVTQLEADALNQHWENIYGFQVKQSSLNMLTSTYLDSYNNFIGLIHCLLIFCISGTQMKI